MTSTNLDRREGAAPPSGRDILLLAQIVDLIRTGVANTRPDLEQATSLGRTVVNERLREGMDLGILEEGGTAQAERGRPSRTVRFRAEAGLILSAGFADNALHAALSDLDGTALARSVADADVLDGPDVVLPVVQREFQALLKRAGRGRPVWGVALGLPGPVDFASGRMVAPPIMHGWDGYDVRGWFRNRYEAPVWVDNDDNLRAFGEWAIDQPDDVRDLLYVEIGEGIGSGFVTDGRLHRGDTGAAGDIGHFRVTDDPTAVCRCGRIGCLAAVASGWGLSRILTRAAERGESAMLAELLATEGRIAGHELAKAIAASEPVTMAAVRRAARLTGLTVAGLVNFANPGTLVLGGSALRGTDVFFDTFKAAVLEQTIELAARRLVIRPSTADFEIATLGGALLVARRLLHPQSLQLWLGAGTPIGSAVRIQELV
ncbi:ROK family protein [Amnibacterium sp. CER49]|uniref:ROK family protein n=1 Tax=Amnibacterium sp. CER49 TaxID=3039161 RepID=UPI00244BF472|nr:ROK family protein [Amnibacterium sp. CER49]MDH2444870.1 ROK family protein [Amnibacterium sp. CER49]